MATISTRFFFLGLRPTNNGNGFEFRKPDITATATAAATTHHTFCPARNHFSCKPSGFIGWAGPPRSGSQGSAIAQNAQNSPDMTHPWMVR